MTTVTVTFTLEQARNLFGLTRPLPMTDDQFLAVTVLRDAILAVDDDSPKAAQA